jgi:hypothetical protein
MVRLHKWRNKFSLRQIASGTKLLARLLPQNISAELGAVTDVVQEIADVVEKTPPQQ